MIDWSREPFTPAKARKPEGSHAQIRDLAGHILTGDYFPVTGRPRGKISFGSAAAYEDVWRPR
jgi:hypothetical protein